jgi:WD40 repeat protein
MGEEDVLPIILTTPLRTLEDHDDSVQAVVLFPDRRRIVTGSFDKTLRLWDLKDGIMLKKMEGHHSWVQVVALSRDGQLIASGDVAGELIAWHGDTGEALTPAINAHSSWIRSLDFTADGTVLVTGSQDGTVKLWSTKTWRQQGEPIHCSATVTCVRYSPAGDLLAIATDLDIQIRNTGTKKCINFKGHAALNIALVWTPDGTRVLSAGCTADPTIREWDSSTWQQVGDPWNGHTREINAIDVNVAGTLVVSASNDNTVRLWRLSDARTINIFNHSGWVNCVTYSTDDKYLLTGAEDKISEWPVAGEAPEDEASNMVSPSSSLVSSLFLPCLQNSTNVSTPCL